MSPPGRGMALALLLLPALAAAQDERPSEEELFGSPDEPPATAPQQAPPAAGEDAPTDPRGQTEPSSPVQEETRDDRVLGGGGVTQGEASAKLAEAYDRLAVGGLLFLTTEYQLKDGGSHEEDPLTSPNLLDLYLDARPGDRVRSYTRLRLTYNPAIRAGQTDPASGRDLSQTQFILDQLWIKFDVERELYVTFGKQRIKWGAGRFWNPSDFLNQQRLDPLAVLDLRTGVYLLKLHYPLEALGWNLYAIFNLQDAQSPQDVGGALRGEFLIGPVESALTVAVRQQSLTGETDVNPAEAPDGPVSWRLGLDLSSGLGPFDVRAEAALVRGLNRPFVDRDLPLSKLLAASSGDLTQLRTFRADEWFPQVVVGAEIPLTVGDQDSFALGAEYFYNGAGYDYETVNAGGLPVPLLPLLFATGGYEALYIGQHYAAAYAVFLAPADFTTLILSAIANLSDGSEVVRFDYRRTFLQFLRFNTYVTGHLGDGELRPGFDLSTIPGVPAGAAARVLAPDAEVGVGLSVDL